MSFAFTVAANNKSSVGQLDKKSRTGVRGEGEEKLLNLTNCIICSISREREKSGTRFHPVCTKCLPTRDTKAHQVSQSLHVIK